MDKKEEIVSDNRRLEEVDPEAYQILELERQRQAKCLVLIPSENYVSRAVLEVQGSIFTNKYSEGYPGRRYYHGNTLVDEIEALAIERAKRLFGAEHANVQPHSGAEANMAAYFALLRPGDVVLAMDLTHGGHLTHGSHVNFSGQLYSFAFYGVDRVTEMIDYESVLRIAKRCRPKLVLAGATAYPRIIDFSEFRKIADVVGAYLMADIAHTAGLVIAGCHPNPVPYADVVMTTTHKTLRGPRGAILLCKSALATEIDRAVFPGIQAGPHEHTIAAKAVALKEASEYSFTTYQRQVIKNAKVLGENLLKLGFRLISGGTANHLLVVDLRPMGIEGKEASDRCERCGIVVNKNTIPFDPNPPWKPSGIRLGTPALTSRGFREEDMKEVAELLYKAITRPEDAIAIRSQVEALCAKFTNGKDKTLR